DDSEVIHRFKCSQVLWAKSFSSVIDGLAGQLFRSGVVPLQVQNPSQLNFRLQSLGIPWTENTPANLQSLPRQILSTRIQPQALIGACHGVHQLRPYLGVAAQAGLNVL